MNPLKISLRIHKKNVIIPVEFQRICTMIKQTNNDSIVVVKHKSLELA